MSPRHRVSRAAIELIKRFEGYRRNAAQLPDGRWTIGYGHTLTAREGTEVGEQDAEALLLYDLISIAHEVNEQVYAPLTQNQFDALCSFAFNLGLDTFRRTQVLKRLNAGAVIQAACAMELWRKAEFEGERIVVDALVRRRAAEKALFLTPPGDAWVPAPSPVLRPLIDLDALDQIPLRRPATLETSLDGDRVVVRREDEAEHDAAPPPPWARDEASPAVAAAAEAVTGRLEALFADPGEEPEPEPDLFDARPQADFAPPITMPFEPDSAPQPHSVVLDDPEPAAEPDLELEIPKAPPPAREPRAEPQVPPPAAPEPAPYEFIPARTRPAPRRREPSIAWDLALALLGLAFFGFGVFWGLNATAAPTTGLVTPIMVAWPAGLAGVGFVVVAVFRLLQRLGRAADQD
jgi:lysozyme